MNLKYTLTRKKAVKALNGLQAAIRELLLQADETHLKKEGMALELRRQIETLNEAVGHVATAIEEVEQTAFFFYNELEAVNNPGFQN